MYDNQVNDRGTCAECGTSTGVKKDGDLWRHKNPEGFYCDNVSTESSETQHPEVIPAPEATPLDTTPEQPTESEDVTGADAPKTVADPKNVFTHEIAVASNSPYVGSPNWESSNGVVAYKKAKAAGKKPTGEARCVSSETVGRKRVLTYEVPVE